jgi:integrase
MATMGAQFKLSDRACKTADYATSRKHRLFDGNGLFLLLTPKAKYWRLKFYLNGKQRLIGFGKYPETSLQSAREKAAAARESMARGQDPVRRNHVVVTTDEPTFQAVAEEWMQTKDWKPRTEETVRGGMEKDLFPFIGNLPIKQIDIPTMRGVLQQIERRGALVRLVKCRQWASEVFRHGIATGQCDFDPAAPLKGRFKTRKPKHHNALIKPDELGEMISKIRTIDNTMIRNGLLLAAFTFTRTSEIRHMEWSDVNLEKSEWVIPAEKMKMAKPHVVPLSKQAVNLLEELKQINGHSRFVFPGRNHGGSPVMSENTLLYNIYKLGFKDRATTHGLRAAARSCLHQELGFPPHVIELQLAHQEKKLLRHMPEPSS